MALVTGYATDKLTELGEGLIRKHVIERWTRKRAVEFYRSFCATLLSDNPDGPELAEMLHELLQDETRSEIVFEAYRLVCLAKSKTVGPRIIAVLVAEIVQRDGVADKEEELVLAAAEKLSDSELVSFAAELAKLPNSKTWGDIEVTLDTRQIDSNFSVGRTEISQGSLAQIYGSWAEKLKSLGFLTESVTERTFHYREDSKRHIDMDGSVRKITWKIFPLSERTSCKAYWTRVDGSVP
ncbi:MAG TPA: hypothetical protein VEY92_01920 [Pseudoxanthomonas sp.]|nr:hypothetical protein [Pseudoxanthomonas sp.]